ncbi:MAG TPA: aminotransferase class III-fold pyridoxal phosphate-dependent enzyme [Euzebya sp.]|nr:aminotransferase class III-fold pyridoxal phosphate-dependent enzyme [Euzebya sp.]
MVTNADLTARARAVSPSWLVQYYDQPLAIDRGEGRHVWDVEGTRYLDFFGGILTTMTAHALPEVTAAVQAQAAKILHTSTLYLSEPMVELAELIAAQSGIPDAKVFFTPSGTEANDAALLLCTALRRSNQVLAIRNSYHGRSFSTVAITGNRSWSPTSLSGLDVKYVHGGYRLRSPFRDLDDPGYIDACVQDLRDVLDMMTSGDVACMIAEPIQGVGGFATPPDGLFRAFHDVLAEYGIPFIADEVQTGWGRTGEHFWGYQAHDFTPELLTFAKGIGNGLALGGVVAGPEIMDCMPANSISTFGGNPLSTAGALANLRYVLDHDLQGNALKMGARMRDRLQQVVDSAAPSAAEDRPGIAELRGKGLMLAVETVQADGMTPDLPAATAILEACKRRGVLVGKGGLYGNVLRLAPPLSVTEPEIDTFADTFAEAIAEVYGTAIPTA